MQSFYPKLAPNFTAAREVSPPRQLSNLQGSITIFPTDNSGWESCLNWVPLKNFAYLRAQNGGFGACIIQIKDCIYITCQEKASVWLCSQKNWPLNKRYYSLRFFIKSIYNHTPDVSGRFLVGGQWLDVMEFNVVIIWDYDGC
jgi:hypothetical protein